MGISTYCTLNLFPPPISSPISRPAEVACNPAARERSWKSQCLLGLTCAIIGLELGNFAVVGDQERAIAADMPSAASKIIIRWSDRRACQPWRPNSLETIVPENLPRPSATGFSESAPPVKVVARSRAKSCFYL
ncbi:uncharacterized protein LOC105165067 [Sesamum indicum]|uniref:Uncharacterized protein LOC105165067 n=1 Tax=Sesamum indicum TaxID=4182 RepID=A0A6I9TMH8_SESIN|nr:uncharacterized protein LOC105165067 [Sesamum indicum]